MRMEMLSLITCQKQKDRGSLKFDQWFIVYVVAYDVQLFMLLISFVLLFAIVLFLQIYLVSFGPAFDGFGPPLFHALLMMLC